MYLVLDLETNSKKQCGRTASPWVNDIVAYSWASETLQITRYIEEPYDIEDLVTAVTKCSQLVAFNAKFECLYLWEYDKFQEWLKAGNTIFCPQLAEYYITNYKTQMSALRELVTTKYNCPVRVKHIDNLLFKAKDSIYNDVCELPVELVLEDVKDDVKDTKELYLKQHEEINKRGKAFKSLLNIQMDFLLATTEMEYNGMLLDKKVLEENKAELEIELAQYESTLNKLISKYWVVE